ncbi:MAG: FAD-dependent oxidoreductase [bacterium]|nr:FAD-dependent oxidoreductase [bacterium]
MNHVIVGCGAAGIAAAETLRRISPSDAITIISDEAEPLYSRCLIPYRLAGPSGPDLAYRDERFFERNGIAALLGRRAVSLARGSVRLDDGTSIGCDRILIATGGRPTLPAIPGIEKQGVAGFRTRADLARILALLPTTRRAAVLGGGCIGLQVAAGLMEAGVTTSIVIASPSLLSQVADETAGSLYRSLFSDRGARIITGVEATAIEGDDRAARVRLGDGGEVDCDLVVVAKGVTPNTECAREAGIRCRRGIVVDGTMMTSLEGVYAAGDVAETRDAATGERTVNALWPCASEQGRVAGSNMAGVPRDYDFSLRMNAVEFFGLPMISVGVVSPRDGGYEVHARHDPSRPFYRKLVFREDRLVGLIMAGEIAHAGVLTALIRKRLPLGPAKGEIIAGRIAFPSVLDVVRSNREGLGGEYADALLALGG